ncbi:MAG: ABC transporter ATP-binding protein [Alphaproteobacteria bacterium]
MTAKIEIKNLRKTFRDGQKVVLKDINVSIKKGESFVMIGGSGTGKSVFLKCILGLLKPDGGSIKIDGEEFAHRNRRPYDKFGMLFQGGALFDSFTIWENVAFGLIHGKRKMSPHKARDLAIEKLYAVGLSEDVAFNHPAELSGGMQKRVALARAIATEPEIIFFDEPTTGLDPIMGDVINNLIRKCVKDLGATAISITHDMASVRRIADRVGMLYKGELIWDGSIRALDRSGCAEVDQFICGRAEGPIDWATAKR